MRKLYYITVLFALVTGLLVVFNLVVSAMYFHYYLVK
jgi:hypothetical protein